MTNGIRANDSRRILSNRCFDSNFPIDPNLHHQYTTMEPGFMALSIYCAQMAPKWNRLLALRPKQLKDMSVQAYYDEFFNWKKRLEEVNYIGDEESYMDDFLFGLKMDLAVSVLRYKWKPRTLYGAFRRAEIEEIMLSRKENSRKTDADKVFDGMSHPESMNSAELQGSEDISDENSDDVQQAEEQRDKFLYGKAYHILVVGVCESEDKAYRVFEEMSQPNSINIADTIGAEGSLDEDNYGVIEASGSLASTEGFSHMHNTNQLQFPKCMNGMAVKVRQPHSKLDSLKDVPHMFDKMPKPAPIQESVDEDLEGEGMVNGSTKGSFKAGIEEATPGLKLVLGKNVMEMDALKVLYNLTKPIQTEVSVLLSHILHALRTTYGLYGYEKLRLSGAAIKILHNGSVSLIDDGIILSFDPGGYSLHHMDCGLLKLNGEYGDYYLETAASVADKNKGINNVSESKARNETDEEHTVQKQQDESRIASAEDQVEKHANAVVVMTATTENHFLEKRKTTAAHLKKVAGGSEQEPSSMEKHVESSIQSDKIGRCKSLVRFSAQYFESDVYSPSIKLSSDDPDEEIYAAHQITLLETWYKLGTVEGGHYVIKFEESICMGYELVCSSSFDNGIVVIEWTVFIWDPGLCAIFIYILEDKDVFKRVRKWMISMDTILDVVGYGHVLVLNEMLNIWITKIRPSILRIAYRDDEDSESDSTSNFLLLKLERHQWGNLYVSYVIFRRMGRAFFSRFRRTLSQLVGKRLSSNTISIRLLYFLPKATIPNMSYGPYEPSSAGICLEYQPLFHFRLPLAPPIAVVDVKSSSCSRLGRLENEELWSSTLITPLAIKIDEGSNKNFEIKVGYGLAIEIKYFWGCVSNASQIFLIDDDRFKKGHKLVALIEATILEHFVWDPGLIWGFSSHHPEIQTFHKQQGLIFFLHQQAISRVCTTLRTRLLLRGGVCHELSR